MADESSPVCVAPNAESGPSDSSEGQGRSSSDSCYVDTTYIRSIEGILKLVSLPVAVLGVILSCIGLFLGAGGWFFFVGVSFIIYVTIVIVIETFVPRIYVHRLIDAIVSGVYAGLWGLTALINTGFAIGLPNVLLGIGSIFAYVCCGLCVAQVVFAIMTWQRNGQKNGPSQPVIGEFRKS